MAATESTGAQTRELDKTPTWAVAGVCAVIIIISIVLEKVLHKLGAVSGLILGVIVFFFFFFFFFFFNVPLPYAL
jgi:membrane-associated phospholipid phosphatase